MKVFASVRVCGSSAIVLASPLLLGLRSFVDSRFECGQKLFARLLAKIHHFASPGRHERHIFDAYDLKEPVASVAEAAFASLHEGRDVHIV